MIECCDMVDEDDKVILTATREVIREHNLLHRVSNILVFKSQSKDKIGNQIIDTTTKLLIHQRTSNKDLFPSYFDLMIGETLKAGETYKQAALRGLKEELGIINPKLELLGNVQYKDEHTKYLSQLFLIVLNHDYMIQPQKEELEWTKFISLSGLKESIKKHKFCPDGLEIAKHFLFNPLWCKLYLR